MFQTGRQAFEFALAGKATITVQSQKTEVRYTYSISASEDGNVWFVGLLAGPDNNADYAYVGIITAEHEFRLTKKSRLTEESTPVKAFRYTWNAISNQRLPNGVNVHHEGKCGRCNRKLTVPESIESGFGPECSQKMGMAVANANTIRASLNAKSA
jgi:hypothetical protein